MTFYKKKFILQNVINFCKNIIKIFYKKRFILSNLNLKIDNKKILLNCKIYVFRKRKIVKRRIFKKKILKINFFIKKQLKVLHLNNILFNVININRFLEKESINNIYRKIIKYKFTLFKEQRHFFFFDFINITFLFFKNKIDVRSYLKIIVKFFVFLKKRSHSAFLFFIKLLFNFFFTKEFIKISGRKTLGIKFIIKGRLKGKPRKKKNRFIIGRVPCQTEMLNIQYNVIHAYTRYGTFGIKLWINYKLKSYER